jgi:hypothetical protein
MKLRQVYVIESREPAGDWTIAEIHGSGESSCEGLGLPFYKKRLRSFRRRHPKYKFRLLRYLPEKS